MGSNDKGREQIAEDIRFLGDKDNWITVQKNRLPTKTKPIVTLGKCKFSSIKHLSGIIISSELKDRIKKSTNNLGLFTSAFVVSPGIRSLNGVVSQVGAKIYKLCEKNIYKHPGGKTYCQKHNKDIAEKVTSKKEVYFLVTDKNQLIKELQDLWKELNQNGRSTDDEIRAKIRESAAEKKQKKEVSEKSTANLSPKGKKNEGKSSWWNWGR